MQRTSSADRRDRPRLGHLSRRVRQLQDTDDRVRHLIEGFGLGVGHAGGDWLLAEVLLEAGVPRPEIAEALAARWRRMHRRRRHAVDLAEDFVADVLAGRAA